VGLNILFQLVRALEIDSLRLVVDLAVFEDLQDILAKVLSVTIKIAGKLLFDGLGIHRFLYDKMVVRNVVEGNWFAEGPRSLMLFEQF
jgi:hypothetical protein